MFKIIRHRLRNAALALLDQRSPYQATVQDILQQFSLGFAQAIYMIRKHKEEQNRQTSGAQNAPPRQPTKARPSDPEKARANEFRLQLRDFLVRGSDDTLDHLVASERRQAPSRSAFVTPDRCGRCGRVQAFHIDPRTGARIPTPFTMVLNALTTWEKIDRCRETSAHAVIAHNVAFVQMDAAGRLLGHPHPMSN